MVTIYFDKQVFSYLFKAREEKYVRLREKILLHKEEFIFLYSAGHLMDLSNDKSEIKYAEMDFMHSIVDENFLIFDSGIKVCKMLPINAFLNFGESLKNPILNNLNFSCLSKEQISVLNNISDLIKKDIDSLLPFDWLKTRLPIDSEGLLVDKKTLESLFNMVAESFLSDKYKMVRDNVMQQYNPDNVVIGEDANVNEVPLYTPLKMSYFDIVRSSLKQVGFQVVNDFMVYYMSYVFLDFFGFNKESRKKVKFYNLQADAVHSFYGSYCDCLVSDDEGVRDKTKVLYKAYGINTKVYSVDEFIDRFDEAIENNNKSVYQYWDEIMQDYLYGDSINTGVVSDGKMTEVRSSYSYFGYFNQMFVKESNCERIIILCKNFDLTHFILLREIGILVNRHAKFFNDVGTQFTDFNAEIEFPQMQSDKWERVVCVNDMQLCLTKLTGLPQLCFYIKFKDEHAES